jgi:hypothetical protein
VATELAVRGVRPMRWVLPGGAVLEGDDKLTVACRPGAAVIESMKPPAPQPPPPPPWIRLFRWVISRKRLATVKLVVEVLAALVGLIGAVLTLFRLWGR